MAGSQELLFIGGPWDGSRLPVENSRDYLELIFREDLENFKKHVYRRKQCCECDNTTWDLMIHAEIPDDAILMRLIDCYRRFERKTLDHF